MVRTPVRTWVPQLTEMVGSRFTSHGRSCGATSRPPRWCWTLLSRMLASWRSCSPEVVNMEFYRGHCFWHRRNTGVQMSLFQDLSQGNVKTSPYSREVADSLRAKVLGVFTRHGRQIPTLTNDRVQNTPRWRLFGALVSAADDPDATGISAFAQGTPVGVGVKLPRQPALYRRKRKWRLPSQVTADTDEYPMESVWMANYRSALDVPPSPRTVLESDVAKGYVQRLALGDALRL